MPSDRRVPLTPTPRPPAPPIVRPRATQEEVDRAAQQHDDFVHSRRGGVRINLAGRDLSFLNLGNRNLQGGVFTGALFAHAHMANANFDAAILFGSDLSDANMPG